VLTRALELQAQGADTLTVAQIRQIAADLSIPESAVDQALSEHRAGAAPVSSVPIAMTPSYWKRHRLARMVMVSIGVVGGAFVLYAVMRIFP
jgi:hypothetical protein